MRYDGGHPPRRSRSTAVWPLAYRALILLAALAVPASAAAQVTVDSFATDQATLQIPPGGAPSSVSGPGIVGGERDLALDRQVGTGTVTAGVAGGTFSFSSGASTTGEALLSWDGADGDAAVLAPTGLGAADLTTGGANAFRLAIISASAGAELVLEVYTNGARSSTHAIILPAITVPSDLTVPFGSFVARLGSGADFTSVGAVTLRIRGTGASVTLDAVEAVAAAPTVTAQKTDGVTSAAPGDTLQYTITVSNSGGGNAAALALSDTIDPNTTLVPGSLEVSPLARDDEYPVATVNTPLTVPAPGVLANDVDGNGDPLVVAPTGARATARGGSASVNGDGGFTYTPPIDFRGVDTFPYQADDGKGIPGPGVVTVTVNCPTIAVNPTTLSDGSSGTPYGPVTFSQTGAAGAVTWTSTVLPSGLTFSTAGVLSGTPTQAGSFTVTFTAADSIGCTGAQTITFAVNEAPTITSANNTTFTVGSAGSFTVTTTGFPTPSIARGGVTLPSGVTFVDNGNGTGTLSGTPAAATGGTYAITFQATNTVGSSVVQNFTLTVNQAPLITSVNNTTFTVGSAGSFTVTTTGFPAPSIARGGVTLPSGVTFVDNGNGTGTLSGTPASGTGGTYAITFQAANVAGTSPLQSFTLTVNEAPTAQPDAYTLNANTTFSRATADANDLLDNDTRGFPAALIASFGGGSLGGVVTDHAAGTTVSPLPTFVTGSLTVNANGSFTFTPPTNFSGTYTLAYRLTNVAGSSDTTVTFTVKPVANGDSYPQTVIGNVSVDSSLAPVFSVLANDAGTGLSASLVGAGSAQGGAVILNAGTGTFAYNPPAGYEGPDSFTYTVSGAGGTSAPATVSLTVSGMIWFVNSGGAAGDGRLSSPFNSLAAFQAVNDGIGNHPAASDNVFLFESGSNYTGPVTLLAGQKLIGQDATASLSAITGLTPGTHSATLPAMNSGNATVVNITSSSNDVTLGPSNTVRGLRLGNATGTALIGSSFGTLNLNDVTISTTGAAVSLTSGTAVATFKAISSGGGTNGILLSGVTGPFEVTGDGASDPANTTHGRTTAKSGGGTLALGSGGTITGATSAGVKLTSSSSVILRNMTITANGSGINTGGDGLNATTVTALTLDNLLINNHGGNHGIHGTTVAALSMIHCQVSANATTAGTETPDVWNVRFDNLTGSSSVNGSLFFNSRENVWGMVESGASLLNLGVANSEFRDTASANPGNNGFGVSVFNTANVTVNVSNSAFLRNRGNAIQYAGNDSSGGGTLTVSNSTFEQNTVDVNVAHQGIGKTLDFNIVNNTMRQTIAGGPGATQSSNAINVFLAGLSNPATLLRGTISGNTIGNASVPDSGSQLGIGIDLFASGAGTLTAMVSGNTVQEVSQDAAFRAISSTHTGRANVTVTGNDFSTSTASGLGLYGIDLTAGADPADTGTLCAHLFGNVAAIGDPTLWGIQAQTVSGTPVLELEGYGGPANNTAQINAFLDTTATTVTPPSQSFILAGTIRAASSPCPTP